MAADSNGERIGPYTVLSELGRGGQAIVYLALDSRLGRRVALKVYADPLGRGPASIAKQTIQRFEREAEVASKVEHPGLCAVYEAGEHEGSPFLAMQYIEGRSLAQIIAGSRQAAELTTESRDDVQEDESDAAEEDSRILRASRESWQGLMAVVELIEDAARALHVAHEAGLVHRDIKPGNIMITPELRPVILDFGLVRDVEGQREALTLSAHMLGTPLYMAPEQLRDWSAAVDRRYDVYSLAVTLYELLTLRPPFQAPTFDRLCNAILNTDPAAAASINSRVPRDLDTVLQVALEKEPDRRYQTALAFADDLRRVRKRQPITARPPGPVVRVRRWVDRNPVVATLIGAVGLLLAAALGLTVWKNRELAASYAEALHQSYVANVIAANASIEANEVREARRLLELCEPDLRDWEWHHLHLKADTSSAVVHAKGSAVTAIAVAPGGGKVVSGSADGTVRIWDAAAAKPRAELGRYEGTVHAVSFHHDGERVLSVGGDEAKLVVHRLPSGDVVSEVAAGEEVVDAAAFAPGGGRVALAMGDYAIRVLDTGTSKQLALLQGHEHRVLAVAFAPDGARLVSGDEEGRVMLWDVASGSRLRGPQQSDVQHETAVRAVGFCEGGAKYLSASDDGQIWSWDVATRRRLSVLEAHSVPVYSLSGGDGVRFASASFDRTIALWENGARVAILRGHEEPVRCVALAPGGSLVSGDEDGSLRAWRSAGKRAATVWPVRDDYTSVALGPHRLLSGTSWPGHVRLAALDAADRAFPPIDFEVKDAVAAVAFSPNERRFAVALRGEAQVRVVDAKTGKTSRVLTGPDEAITSLAFASDGARIVAGSTDQTAIVWRVQDGSKALTLAGHADEVLAVAFSSDNRHIATGSADGTARIWDASTGKLVHSTPRGSAVAAVAFSPDSESLATGSADRRVRTWDRASGQLVHTMEGHGDRVSCLAFAAAGRRIVSGSYDKTLRLWDAETGRQLLALRGHQKAVVSVAVGRQGLTIVSASFDGTIRFWNAY